MDRVASVWLTFCVVGGIVGFTAFFIFELGTQLALWLSVPTSWLIGISFGAFLAQFKLTRVFVAWSLGVLVSISWFS